MNNINIIVIEMLFNERKIFLKWDLVQKYYYLGYLQYNKPSLLHSWQPYCLCELPVFVADKCLIVFDLYPQHLLTDFLSLYAYEN